MSLVQQCPVCRGKGSVPNGFYSSTTPTWTTGSTTPEMCRSCNGLGVLWSHKVINSTDLDRLESQIRRLQSIAVLTWEEYYNVALHYKNMKDDDARRYADQITGLHSTDLDPVTV